MIELENVGAWVEGIDRWIEACEELANDAYRGLCIEAFQYCVSGSPEWSGALASQWHLTVGAPVTGYTESPFKGESLGGLPINREPFSRRQPNYAAISYAAANARDSASLIRLGADTYISNPSPYAAQIEAGNAAGKAVRAVNLPIEMVHAAAEKFGRMGELSVAAAVILGQRTL